MEASEGENQSARQACSIFRWGVSWTGSSTLPRLHHPTIYQGLQREPLSICFGIEYPHPGFRVVAEGLEQWVEEALGYRPGLVVGKRPRQETVLAWELWRPVLPRASPTLSAASLLSTSAKRVGPLPAR